MKNLLVAMSLFVAGSAMAAEKIEMYASPAFNGPLVYDVTLDSTRAPAKLVGSCNFMGGSAITVSLTEANTLTGNFSRGMISTKPAVTRGSAMEVEVTALPYGVTTYTFARNAKKELEVRGFGPRGEMTTVVLNATKKRLTVWTEKSQYEVRTAREGKLSGTLVWGRDVRNSGSIDFKFTKAFDAFDLASRNPALFLMLYVLPFEPNR